MRKLKMSSAGHAVSIPDGASDSLNRAAQQSCAPLVIARDAEEQVRSILSQVGQKRHPAPEFFHQEDNMKQLLDSGNSLPSRIAIKAKGHILFVNPAKIVAVEAQGKYVSLACVSGSYLLRESIAGLAEKLKPFGFIRIHRSVLVNTSFVEEIHPSVSGEYILRIRGGKEYSVTRTFKENLNLIAQFWLGTNGFNTD